MSPILQNIQTDTKEIIDDIIGKLAETNRNLISDEFEDGLKYLTKYIPLKVHRYKSGSACWTWNVPKKWRMKQAYIKKNDNIIVSADDHPLHVMSYSIPVHAFMKGAELKEHIHAHKECPEAIPYEFSFYAPKWGFCLTHRQAAEIRDGEEYEVLIDSDLEDGDLSVGEYTVEGSSDEHIFFLSHLDHPFQVNDGLIGVAVNVALAKLIGQCKDNNNYYNYTFLFVPETIGSIAFLSHREDLIPKIRYSVFTEMVGLDHPLIIQTSYKNRGLIDQYAAYVLKKEQGEAKSYPFLTVAGNDEKIFDAPGVNVPSIAFSRVDHETRLKKAGGDRAKLIYPYPEYHSHLDNAAYVDRQSTYDTVNVLFEFYKVIESDFIPKRKFKGPVFLSKYDLWPDWRTDWEMSQNMMSLLYSLEGDKTVFQIAHELDMDFEKVLEWLNKFYDNELIEKKRIPIEYDR